jgi:hypothetical protein
MKEAELQELHILRVSRDYITRLLDEQISALTEKALSLKIKEDDRVTAIAGKNQLQNFRAVLGEREGFLTNKQAKEKEKEDGNRS